MSVKVFSFVVILVSVLGTLSPQGRAATVEVMIQNFAFSPASVRVQPGDTVTWKNLDDTGHTSTSGNSGTANGIWNSSVLGRDQTFSQAFDTAGTFPYFCMPHPFMEGEVIVEAASAGPTIAIVSPANNAIIPAPGPVAI